ncbi:MAG: DUF4386 domain-containing protein [Acidimicrobiales bacterium]|nr:DUF4386 domain-containing protein [Acidimicrobiales bacterium]
MQSITQDHYGDSEDVARLRDKSADTNRSIRQATTIAGVGLLLMSVLSAFGYLVAVKGLVVPGNAARTANKVADHESLFRFGIPSLYLVAALDVVVAWALYRVFKPVSDALSKLAAWLRVAYAGVFVVAISQLVGALSVHTQALRHINSFTNIWDAGLVLFGLYLFVLAYLTFRSEYVPRLLGVLLTIAGFGYVFDSAVRALARGSSSDISAITGIGEFVFALWLVIRGRRITLGTETR